MDQTKNCGSLRYKCTDQSQVNIKGGKTYRSIIGGGEQTRQEAAGAAGGGGGGGGGGTTILLIE